MWIALFSIVAGMSVGLALAAVLLQSQPESKPRKARISVSR